MSENDAFREVDEEMQRERLKKLWDRYGAYVLGAAIAIILGVGGFKGWQSYQQGRAESAGADFDKALELARGKKPDEAMAGLQKLATEGQGGYRALAKLQLAQIAIDGGKPKDAGAIYDALVIDPIADQRFKDFAKIRAAQLMIDDASLPDMQNRLNDMTTSDNPWRHEARELLGLSAFKAGKLDVAEKTFNDILADVAAPRGLRQRAEVMLSLILAKTVKPAAG